MLRKVLVLFFILVRSNFLYFPHYLVTPRLTIHTTIDLNTEMTSLWSSFMGYFASLPITTSPLTNEAEELVVDVLEIYGKLKRRKNLEPCDEVNTIFERLVDHCTLHRRSEVTLQVRSSNIHFLLHQLQATH